MMLAAALLLSLPTIQAEPRVTLDLPALRLDKALERIGAASGAKLATSGPGAAHYVFIKVKDMPLSRLKELVAMTVEGSWSQRGDIQVLTSSLPANSTVDTEMDKRISAWFAKAKDPGPLTLDTVSSIVKEVQEYKAKVQGGSPADWQDMQKLSRKSPSDRALARIALALGKDFFLSLPSGSRTVLSPQPTRLQRALPAGAIQAVETMKRELPLFADKFKGVTGGEYTGGVFIQGFDEMNWQTPSFDGYHVVAVRRRGEMSLSLARYSKDGSYVTSQIQLGTDFTEDFDPKAKSTLPEALNFKDPVVIDPKDAAVAEGLQNILPRMGGRSQQISAEARNALLAMDQRDLLDYQAATALRQTSDKLGKGVVAFLPDVFMLQSPITESREGKQPSLGKFLESLSGSIFGNKSSLKLEEDALVIPPPTSSLLRSWFLVRINRDRMAGLLRRAAAEGMTLDVMADMALTLDLDELGTMFTPMVAAVAGEQVSMFYNPSGREVLKVYGHLNATQRRQARNGGIRLVLGSMHGDLGAAVNKLIFSSDSAVTAKQKPGEGQEQVAGDMDVWGDDSRYVRGVSSHTEEPTFALANGWPSGSYVEIKVTGKEAVYGFMNPGSGMDGFSLSLNEVRVRELAWQTAYKEKAGSENAWGVWEQFSIGSKEVLNVTIDFGQTGEMKSTFVHDRNRMDAKRMKMSEMPAAFQEEFQKALVKAREDMKNITIGPGPTNTTKPPQ